MVDFAADELVQALGEVGWGFKTWEILPTIPYEASARLELLEEGWWIVVCVSERGWEVVERHTAEEVVQSTTFETLDNLLGFISPAFDNRRMKLLTEKLETISTRRSWGEDEGYTEAEV